MTTQASSALNPNNIDLGGAILYYAEPYFPSLSAAIAATTWRKFGILKEGVTLAMAREQLDFYSGTPSVLVKRFVTSESLTLSGSILETRPDMVARALGGLDITRTLKTTSPAPSTVVSGSTKTSIIFADSTGYAVEDEIQVGNAGSEQVGTIKTLDSATDTAVLYEALSLDATPTVGHAIAKVDKTTIATGTLSNPDYIGIKLVHTLIGGYGTLEIYIPKAQMLGQPSFVYGDNVQTPDSIGLPFEVSAIADAAIESGKTSHWIWTQD